MYNRKNVELKKVNSKHIFKSTLTPQMPRKSELAKSGIDKDAADPTAVTGVKSNKRINVNINGF